MRNKMMSAIVALFGSTLVATTAVAEWVYNGSPYPNATIQTNNMSLEVQCDRIRFAPAGYEDSEDIVRKNGLSFRFLANGSQEVAAFQMGRENSFVQIVDNYPVEIQFSDEADYAFVLDQIAANATLNLSMVDQDVSYSIFDLKGSGTAIQSLQAECRALDQTSAPMEAPEGVVYCGGGGIKRKIEFVILDDASDEWDARVTVNGETQRAMTSYSYFGNSEPVKDFVVALLAEDRAEFLIFRNRRENWLEFGDYRYDQCN
ncbi:hypothetical protein [Ruegeria sp. Alg231-54]|uniref:hypothetical protein n=1 Tax=Ruegeria sp. Alg231-54 TaxID=1922221 RepID=UPI001F23C745|nr:hypothetical protein [Ruegeria sp. Alg231-54]